MKRVIVPELLDSDTGTEQQVQGSLADLRMFNRHFGGVRTTRELLRAVAEQRGLKDISWLDVAGANGDLATLVRQSLLRDGINAQAVILDRAWTHMNGRHPGVSGDALALPFADDSFDIVASSLFAHHLEPEEIKRFIREGLRVARHAFVIHDLIRHPLHWALALAGAPIYRSAITRHDAPASVRRAYTVQEMRSMLEDAAASRVEMRTFFLFRMGAVAWKPITT
jgi:ubiquinone/menaquinone biosynthesis C-methylase UbiE